MVMIQQGDNQILGDLITFGVQVKSLTYRVTSLCVIYAGVTSNNILTHSYSASLFLTFSVFYLKKDFH